MGCNVVKPLKLIQLFRKIFLPRTLKTEVALPGETSISAYKSIHFQNTENGLFIFCSPLNRMLSVLVGHNRQIMREWRQLHGEAS
jgi:hypothetical protein